MSRSRKLLLVGIVLAVGFGLAWPFRKTITEVNLESAAMAPQFDLNRGRAVAIQQPIANSKTANQQSTPMRSPAPYVAAKMTSMGDVGAATPNTRSMASFDLANHPALAGLPNPPATSPVTPLVSPQRQTPLKGYLPAQIQKDPRKKNLATARPAYATADRDRVLDASEQLAAEVRHVVQNSDTLEKLAKRYLGDENRALEIFDLNRDVLDNPHLLPIDAELRIPVDPRRTID